MTSAPPDDHAALTPGEAASRFDALLGQAVGIVVAVSGGPDSMALLALVAGWTRGRKLIALTVDHGLRADSAAEAAAVARYAQTLGVAHSTLTWAAAKPSSGLQAAAREARYRLLTDHARSHGCTHLVTAHHADDQAETVLMRLIAGSGVDGLAAMREAVDRDGIVQVRPLLGVPKARLIATCTAMHIPSVHDPSNLNERFGRARLRRLLPLLAKEGLTAERLATLAGRAAQAADALDVVASRALALANVTVDAGATHLDWRSLTDQPREIRLRILAKLVRGATAVREPLKLERLETLLRAIDAAAARRQRLRRSIADLIVTLDSAGGLALLRAPVRKRGCKAGGQES